jgi:hypothetical protein
MSMYIQAERCRGGPACQADFGELYGYEDPIPCFNCHELQIQFDHDLALQSRRSSTTQPRHHSLPIFSCVRLVLLFRLSNQKR